MGALGEVGLRVEGTTSAGAWESITVNRLIFFRFYVLFVLFGEPCGRSRLRLCTSRAVRLRLVFRLFTFLIEEKLDTPN